MLQKDLREFIALLNAKNVRYLFAGAHAMAYYGCPRSTGDMGVLVEREPGNAARIMKALAAFGFEATGLAEQDFLTPDMVVQLGHPPNRIDILTSITGVEFEEAWAGRARGTLDGLPVDVLSRKHLIQNKSALGRPKDLADIAYLEGN